MPKLWLQDGDELMGQHKHNPTAIAAKRGKLPPKQPKKSKALSDAEMRMAVLASMEKHVPGTAKLLGMLEGNRYVF